MEKQEDIFNRIEECIKNITLGKIDTINYFDRIEQDLGIDSMGVTELVFTLEDVFNIEISDDDVSEIKIVKDIVKFINSKSISEVNLKTAM